MTKFLGPLMLTFALVGAGAAQSTNACNGATTAQGSSFTWSNSYSVPLKVTPATSTTWFLGVTSIQIPANGQVTVNVPSTAAPGDYAIQVTFDTRSGGTPCIADGNPHIHIIRS